MLDLPTLGQSRPSTAGSATPRVSRPARGGDADQGDTERTRDEQREAELYIREMDALDPRPIPGTVNARAPFFSADGLWLGFLARGAIWKVALTGGSPQKICEVGRPIGFDASWAPDGQTIVFATDDGLWQVSATGGTPEQLTTPDETRGEVGHHSPRITASNSSSTS